MPTTLTLTLKNVPDTVYQMLKAFAKNNHRSLSSEAIVWLEAVLTRTRVAPGARLARARALRAPLSPVKFKARDVQLFKRRGRP